MRKPLVLDRVTQTRLPFWTVGQKVIVGTVWLACSSGQTLDAKPITCRGEKMQSSDISIAGLAVFKAEIGTEIEVDKPLAFAFSGKGDAKSKQVLEQAWMVMQYRIE